MATKLTNPQSKILTEVLAKLSAETLLLLITEKLTPEAQKSSWYQDINKMGAIITIWPLEPLAFKQWLKQQFQKNKLLVDGAVIDLIVERTEGNLLAASQEVTKLTLLFPHGKISAEELTQIVTDNSHYDIFNLVDTALEGEAKKISKVLHKLRAEGTEPTLILWAITREIRKLIHILRDLRANVNWETISKKYQLWDKRQPLFKRVLKVQTLTALHQLLLHAETIDQKIKGLCAGNVWDELQQLTLGLAGFRKSS